MAKHALWSDAARADVRALDRTTAGEGDVKKLIGKENEFRLRLGDYRLCFTPEADLLIVHWVRHQREAYRD